MKSGDDDRGDADPPRILAESGPNFGETERK